MTHRSWFPLILTGLSLSLLACLTLVYRPNDEPKQGRPIAGGNETSSTATGAVAPSSTEYETAVRNVVASYDATGDASAAYSVLVALRVPAAYQAAHLDLVIAFAQLQSGKRDDGTARLAGVRAAYAWLALPL